MEAKPKWNTIVYPHNTFHSLDVPSQSLQLRVPTSPHGAVSIGLSFLHPMTEKDGKTMGLGRYDITLNRNPNEAEFSFFGPGQPQTFTKPHIGIVHAKKLIRALLEEHPHAEVSKILKQRKFWDVTFQPKPTLLQRIKAKFTHKK